MVNNVAANKKILVEYPVAKKVEKKTLGGEELTLYWRGNYVVQMEPMGLDFPAYSGRSYYELNDGKGYGFLSDNEKIEVDSAQLTVAEMEDENVISSLKGVDKEKWVRLDLGKTYGIDEVVLYPANPDKKYPGYCFPIRFIVEASDDPYFQMSIVISDHTKADFANPGDTPVVLTAPKNVKGRFVRVKATKLIEKQDKPNSPTFAVRR